MQRRKPHLVLLGLILAVLAGVGLIAIPGSPAQKDARLGLDLQGGLEIVLEAVPPKGKPLDTSAVSRSVTIIRNRVDKLGVSEPEIRKQGETQIVVQLPGLKDPQRAFEIIGKTAQLELYDLQANLVAPSIDTQGFPVATQSLYELIAGQQGRAKDGDPTAFYLFNKKKQRIAGPADTEEQVRAEYRRAHERNPKIPAGARVLAVPADRVVISCSAATAVVCPGVGEIPEDDPRTFYYLLRYQPNDAEDPIPEMTGADLKLDGTQQDFDPQTSLPIVRLDFTGAGRRKFHDITREEAVRGKLCASRLRLGGDAADQCNQNFAIVLDRELQSFPSIDFQDYPDGIDPVNGAQITGLRDIGEAKDLALVLQTGALPVEFVALSQSQISATLGEDSLREAKTAALIGLMVVALFLLVFYRFIGLVAVIGLGIYSAFLYGVILLLDVTLTLPGFAGMILTIGVAADANVVIAERIKEEVRSGKSVRAAVASGYGKGFAAIVDANVVTAITAVVLFAVATAGVKGFALMLLLGTALSLITAVAATRAMLGLLAGFRWFDSPRVMGASPQQGWQWLHIDYVGKFRIWFALSGVVLLVAILSIGVKDLNFGIDFRGGTQVTFKTPQAVPLSEVRDQAAQIGQADAVIQGRGVEKNGRYREFVVRTPALDGAEQGQLRDDLVATFDAQSIGVNTVSSSFGRDIARLAILAIIVSLLLIVIYISIRFDKKYALPAIAALVHDSVIAIGIYALAGSEISTASVAALLTIMGYSIYDTMIIFDRIRENVPLMRRASYRTIVNVSLWETIRRSLATTFITLLPVIALYLFGGETLKSFAFALLVGIGSGAYSSIFFAPQILTLLKEREPEWKRRMGATEIESGVGQVVLAEAVKAAADEPPPDTPLLPEIEPDDEPPEDDDGGAAAPREPAPRLPQAPSSKRDRRRQRRRSRPHGRR